MSIEKEISYTTQNTYSTLNLLTPNTKNIWLVFHGMGYLSRYFIHHFKTLNPEGNYIIAPQAPSKYYQDSKFKRIGANWLTRENTKEETKNIIAYVNAIYDQEMDHSKNLIVMGYSQGVSIACRWLANRKPLCEQILIHSGGIPKELRPEDFDFLKKEVSIHSVYGDKDPFLSEERKKEELLIGKKLFGDRLQIKPFNGVHEVHIPALKSLVLR